MKTIHVTIELVNDDGEPEAFEVPACYEVCGRCMGEGRYVDPRFDGHGITEREFSEEWSDDERAAYFAGRYDVTCSVCSGLRVVRVIDRDSVEPELLVRIDERAREEELYRQIVDAERRMGA